MYGFMGGFISAVKYYEKKNNTNKEEHKKHLVEIGEKHENQLAFWKTKYYELQKTVERNRESTERLLKEQIEGLKLQLELRIKNDKGGRD